MRTGLLPSASKWTISAVAIWALAGLCGCSKAPSVPPAQPVPAAANLQPSAAHAPSEPSSPSASVLKTAEATERALKVVQDLGGKVEYDQPGQSVIAVDLSEKAVSDQDLAALTGLPELRSLNIAGNASKISDAGLRHLQGLKRLETLVVPAAAATDQGLEHIAALSTLQQLQIGYFCPATDAGFGHLKSLTSLKSLNVSYTSIGDAGLEQLRPLINLESLILNSTKVTDAGLESLQGMKSLRYLALGECNVTNEAKQKLKSSLPQCDIPFPADK